MFEQRGVEFLIIAGIALIVVGPKELPGLLRKLGQFVGKMRNIANDFRTSFDEMARQSELDDLRKQVEEMRSQTAAAVAQDHTGLNQAMQDFQMTSLDTTPDYGASSPVDPVPETIAAAPAPKRAPRKKAAAKAPVKKAPAKKPATKAKRAASTDIVQ